MIVAVAPYPIQGVWDDDEIIHRIHNTVGSVQYLPLWALPVLVWCHRRHDLSAWRLAVSSGIVIAATALPTGDLFASGSWLPLATIVPLWPVERNWREWLLPNRVWRRGERMWLLALPAAVMLWWVVAVHIADYIEFQDVSGGDTHGVRFHYGGMAAAVAALAGAATLVCVWGAGRVITSVTAVSAIAVGTAHVVWSEYDSGMEPTYAWMTIAAGLCMAPLAFRRWPVSQNSLPGAVRSPSSSSRQRPTTPS